MDTTNINRFQNALQISEIVENKGEGGEGKETVGGSGEGGVASLLFFDLFFLRLPMLLNTIYLSKFDISPR